MKDQENIEQDELECSNCKSRVKADDEFCPQCGTLFEDGVMCSNHSDMEASGVCIICCQPFCEKCGEDVNLHFLCHTHSHYEIYQQMARVFGDLDDTRAQYIKSCLEQAGLHPFIYCRVQPKGGSRLVYTLFEASGDPGGHIVNEVKVMVPWQEVVTAEEILRELDFIE